MSEIIIISSFGNLVCKDFQLNRDIDVLEQEEKTEDIPLPETEVSE